MMLESRVSTCGEVADTARRLMVVRSRTGRRTVLNWGAVVEVVEGIRVAGMGEAPIALGTSSSLSSSIRSDSNLLMVDLAFLYLALDMVRLSLTYLAKAVRAVMGCCWALERSLRMAPDSPTLFCRDSRRALSGS